MSPAQKKRPTKRGRAEPESIIPVDIETELSERFLSYALSTIMARALPDARDGLKPVHRRILYAMRMMRLGAGARFRKSAAVVGDVIGKYHPHGDQAVYDAAVRMAQDFSLRYPLIEGSGNFGDIDGYPAAAMRYTEARLTELAEELMLEIDEETVEFTPNYDQRSKEPRYLPARFPNLLVNGATGIAVGLATSIPPHNMDEVIDALVRLIDDENLSIDEILQSIKGPDYPTGGIIIASKKELAEIYQAGRGSFRTRAQWKIESERGKTRIVIHSIPYGLSKGKLIEKIAELIISKKVPDIIDARDESTEEIRIVLETRSAKVDHEKIMAYLFKKTDLEVGIQLNLTASLPSGAPARLSLIDALKLFIEFRIETTERKLRFRIAKLNERLHILRALCAILLDLDRAIAIIRSSKTRADARDGLVKAFRIDQIQADAILDLKLAAIVGLEIDKIRLETAQKEAELEEIEKVVGSTLKIKRLARKELNEIRSKYPSKRRSKIVSTLKEPVAIDEETFIADEDNYLIVSKWGWARRVRQIKDLDALRFKDDDQLLAAFEINSREFALFFTSTGKFYSIRANEITQTTGFGDPIQTLFRFDDGERLVMTGALRSTKEDKKLLARSVGESIVAPIIDPTDRLLFVSENGFGFRFSAEILGPTNKTGKKIATVRADDATLLICKVEKKLMLTVSTDGYALLYDVNEITTLSGVGRGVKLMRLKSGERLLFARLVSPKDKVRLIHHSGADATIKITDLEKGSRAQTGRKICSPRKKLLACSIV